MSHVLTQVDLAIDQVKPNRPRALLRRLSALHQFMLDSRWPAALQPNDDADHDIDYIEEIHERAILCTSSCKQQPGDDMAFLLRDKLQQVMLRPEVADLHALLSKLKRQAE